jgi:hypothetical protein
MILKAEDEARGDYLYPGERGDISRRKPLFVYISI